MGRMTKALAKRVVLDALDKLPEERLEELVDFTEFILLKVETLKVKPLLDPNKDPILKLIGSLDVEPFADKIDDELYGERS